MTSSRPWPLVRPRIVALGLVALALLTAIIGFVGMVGRWPADFATIYTATLASQNGANVYDYALLTQLNATHHYVAGAIYPFTYPPFVLFIARPLAALPFAVARVVWAAVIVLATVGTAALLSDAMRALLAWRSNAGGGAGHAWGVSGEYAADRQMDATGAAVRHCDGGAAAGAAAG